MDVKPLTAPRQRPERGVHAAVFDYLRRVLPGAAIHHSPNELDMSGRQAEIMVARAKAMGMRPGWPDIEVMHQGRAMFFEVKAPKNGRLSFNQKEVRCELERNGALWAEVRSIDDARAALAAWGVQTKDATR